MSPIQPSKKNQRSTLKNLLVMDLKLEVPANESIVEQLINGLYDASQVQKAVGGIYNQHDLTHKEFFESLHGLHNALDRISRQTAALSDNLRKVRLRLQEIPREWQTYLDTLDPSFYSQHQPTEWQHFHQSRFLRVASALKELEPNEQRATAKLLVNIVAMAIESASSPGKGGAKKQGRYYIAGIQCLKKHFQAALPTAKVSSKESSKFWCYVSIWLNHCENKDISDPTRHIKNSIQDLDSWKTLPLSSP